jgi:perosamine synthetase
VNGRFSAMRAQIYDRVTGRRRLHADSPGPSFMGGTLSPSEVRLALRHYARPLSRQPGRTVESFEQAFARAVRVPHAVAFGNGRVALWAILRALGVGGDDEVVIPGYTCVAVPNAVRFAGARPVYAEIDASTFNVTAATCEQVVSRRTRAMVVAHTYGLPAPMEELRALAEARGLFLIEDAAHALGSEYRGQPVGSLGDAAFFSTEHSKSISTGLGGVATTTDAALAARLQSIQAACPPPDAHRVRRLLLPHLVFAHCCRTRRHLLGEWLLYRSRLYRRAEWSTAECELDGMEPPGYHWRMGDTQARLGLEQLRRLPRLNAARVATAKAYTEGLRSCGLDPPATPGADRPVYARFPYRARRRDALLAAARAERLELGLWFEAPVHPKGTNLAAVAYVNGHCPVAEQTCRQIVNLPCHPGVTPEDVARYIELLARAEG